MTTPVLLAIVAVLAPALSALLLAALPWVRKLGMPGALVTLTGSLASFGSAIALFQHQLHDEQIHTLTVPWLRSGAKVIAEIGVRVCSVAASMLVVVTLVALCVQVFSVGYMHNEPKPAFGRYFAYHALFLFSMNVLVIAPNLLQLFAGWELVGVTSYLLIGFYYQKPSAGHAAVKAFWMTKLADMGFLFGLLVLFAASGSFGWDAKLDPNMANIVTLLLFVAVIGKSAQFPIHIWLPEAMEGPTPVSALLHAATMVAAGVFMIVRADPLFAQAETTRSFMLILGSATAFFAACLAMIQTDIKKVLAYSTCSQLGYMVAALGAGSMLGGFFHLTTHAFFKALLFLAAGSAIHAVHSNEISHMGGLAKKMPITGTAFIIGSLALAGIPGLSGFFSKDLILEAVEGKFHHIPSVLLFTTAFMTAFYMGRVVLLAFFGTPSEHAEHAHEPGWSMKAPLIVLAILAVITGYFASPLAHMWGKTYHFHVAAGPAIAAALGLAGIGLAYLVYGRGPREKNPVIITIIEDFAKTRAVNRAYEIGFGSIAMPFARIIGWVDRYVVDGAINIIGYLGLEAGRVLRPMQTGRAPDYVLAVVLGVAGLATWAVLQ